MKQSIQFDESDGSVWILSGKRKIARFRFKHKSPIVRPDIRMIMRDDIHRFEQRNDYDINYQNYLYHGTWDEI